MTEAGAARAKAAFIAQLREHYRRCQVESFPKIAVLSHTVSRRYPSRATCTPAREKSETNFVTLYVTTISDVLGGAIRKKLPTWPWTATFVVCCNTWAFDNGVISTDPGRDALPEWARRRWLAKCASQRGGIELPASVQGFLASHGPYGESLIAEVEAGVSDAICRATILLGADPAHVNEALALLLWDKSTVDPVISSLDTAGPDVLDPLAVSRYARMLADNARSRDEADAFNKAADRAQKNLVHQDPHCPPPRSGTRPTSTPSPLGRRKPPSGRPSAAGDNTPG
jgi:hypothetical protein